jgi:hypothetical protein
MTHIYNPLDTQAIENLVDKGATLIRTEPGTATPFAFELASCIAEGSSFFGLQCDERRVALITAANYSRIVHARELLTGEAVHFNHGSITDHKIHCVQSNAGYDLHELARHYTSPHSPGTVLILDSIETMLGAYATPQEIIRLCDAMIEAAADKNISLVISCDAHSSDTVHLRPLLGMFECHAAVSGGPAWGGSWYIAKSDIGAAGPGGSFALLDMCVGHYDNGAQKTATVIDPTTLVTKVCITAPAASPLAEPITPIQNAL